MDRWMNRSIDRWMDRQTDIRKGGWIVVWKDGWMNGQTDDGRKERRMGGSVGGRLGSYVNRKKNFVWSPTHHNFVYKQPPSSYNNSICGILHNWEGVILHGFTAQRQN